LKIKDGTLVLETGHAFLGVNGEGWFQASAPALQPGGSRIAGADFVARIA
jgi:hypothetical protein